MTDTKELKAKIVVTDKATGEVVKEIPLKGGYAEVHKWTADLSKCPRGEPVWDSEHGDLREEDD